MMVMTGSTRPHTSAMLRAGLGREAVLLGGRSRSATNGATGDRETWIQPQKWSLDEAWDKMEGHVPYVECQRRRHALLDQWIAEAEAQVESHRQTEV